MKHILGTILLLLILSAPVQAAYLGGYTVADTVPSGSRYQYYEGVGGSTTLEINVKGDLGRYSVLGYITNNSLTTAVYLHLNFHTDSGDTMRKIKVPAGGTWNFSPASIHIDTLEITSDANIDVDILVH